MIPFSVQVWLAKRSKRLNAYFTKRMTNRLDGYIFDFLKRVDLEDIKKNGFTFTVGEVKHD